MSQMLVMCEKLYPTSAECFFECNFPDKYEIVLNVIRP